MVRILLAFNLDNYHLQENIITDYILNLKDANKDFNKNQDYQLIEFEEHYSNFEVLWTATFSVFNWRQQTKIEKRVTNKVE